MRQHLVLLDRLRQTVRRTLAGRGLCEVVTPVALPSPGGEVHIEAVPITLHPLGATAQRAFLRTSPEVWHKKLLAAQSGPIFEIAPCLRDGEGGRWHDLEFEMVEWYRPGEPLSSLIADLEVLLTAVFAAADRPRQFAFERLRAADLFAAEVGIALRPDEPAAAFAARLTAAGLRCAADDDWDDLFHRAWLQRVEPALTNSGAVIVERFPASQAAMARLCEDDPQYCDRFELYCDGVELANAFAELTDSAEQLHRFRAWQAKRSALGRAAYPEDPSFFAALDQLPETSGIALGLDRLLALATGATDLKLVRPFHLATELER
jgi:lysyl-tRNA synthetase class 2